MKMYLDCNGFDGVSRHIVKLDGWEIRWRQATLALHVKCANKVFLDSPSFSCLARSGFKKELESYQKYFH